MSMLDHCAKPAAAGLVRGYFHVVIVQNDCISSKSSSSRWWYSSPPAFLLLVISRSLVVTSCLTAEGLVVLQEC